MFAKPVGWITRETQHCPVSARVVCCSQGRWLQIRISDSTGVADFVAHVLALLEVGFYRQLSCAKGLRQAAGQTFILVLRLMKKVLGIGRALHVYLFLAVR